MEQNNNNVEVLNLIYKNAEMGFIGIDTVIPKITSEKVAKLVKEQRKEYKNICKSVEELMKHYDSEVTGVSKPKEVMSKMMSEMMTLGASDTKIVKLMMTGNERGIVEIQEKLNMYHDLDDEVLELAHKLIATEEHNRDEFKPYL